MSEQLSKHFTEEELACPCCGKYIPNEELLTVLEDIREKFGPTVITSGTRCEKHNKEIGGAKHSQHLLGTAADVSCVNELPKNIQDYLLVKYPDKYGIGVGSTTFTHIDVRADKARWSY